MNRTVQVLTTIDQFVAILIDSIYSLFPYVSIASHIVVSTLRRFQYGFSDRNSISIDFI